MHDCDLWARRHETTNCNPPARAFGARPTPDSSQPEWRPYGTALDGALEDREWGSLCEWADAAGGMDSACVTPRVLPRQPRLLPERLCGAADDQPHAQPADFVASPTAGCNPAPLPIGQRELGLAHEAQPAAQTPETACPPAVPPRPLASENRGLSRDMRLAIAARSLASTSRMVSAHSLSAAGSKMCGPPSMGATSKKHRRAASPYPPPPARVSEVTGDLIKGRYGPRPAFPKAQDARRQTGLDGEDNEDLTDVDEEIDDDDDVLVRKVLQESGLGDNETSSCGHVFALTLAGALVTAVLLLVYTAVVSSAPLPAASAAAAAATRFVPPEMKARGASAASVSHAPLLPPPRPLAPSLHLVTSRPAEFGAEFMVAAV